MACAAALSLSLRVPSFCATLSSTNILRRHMEPPSSSSLLFPAALPSHILIKPRGYRRPSAAAVFTGIAGVGGDVLQDAGATALVVVGAYALVSTFDNLTRLNIIEQTLSRKLVHIMSGLLFLASWTIFRLAHLLGLATLLL